MKKMVAARRLRLFLLIVCSGYSSFCHAQKRHVNQWVHVYCGETRDPAYEPEDVNVYFEVDGLHYQGNENYYPEGIHTLRIFIKPKPGHEIPARSYVIKKIEWHGEKNDYTKKVIQTFNPNAKEYSVTINITRAEYRAYKAVVQIDKCAEPSYGEAMVKVVTTTSYSPNGAQTPVSDIAVQIGDRPISIDPDGVGWIKMRPENYKMTYSRKFGATASMGTVTLKSSKRNSTQLLGSAARANDPSLFECDVPLLKENTGSGNLFDFELRINMIVSPGRGAVNEVRIAAVIPGVAVHKAGTPEDAWVELEKDAILQEGDEISCDADGSVILQFADGGTTVVKNTTQLKIASYFTEGGVVKTEILLKMGEVAAKVHKSEATKSDFRIKSPTLTTSRRGTWFSHSYDPATKTDIIKVEDGTVDIIPSNAKTPTMTLRTGQEVVAVDGRLGSIVPIKEKIDFSMKGSTTTVDAAKPLEGAWLITQDGYSGKMTLRQSGENLSGSIDWNNHQKGTIQSGTIKYSFVIFTIQYPDGLLGYYNATLDESGKKMINGTGTSNKGTSITWSAVKQ